MYVVLNPVRLTRCHWGGASDPSQPFFSSRYHSKVHFSRAGQPSCASVSTTGVLSRKCWSISSTVKAWHFLGRVRLDLLEVGKSWEKVPNEGPKIGVWEELCRVIHILHWLLTSAKKTNFGVANQHSTVFDDTENPNNPQVHDPFWSLGSIRLWGSTSNFKAIAPCVWWILIMYKYILYVCVCVYMNVCVCVHECVCVHIYIYICNVM